MALPVNAPPGIARTNTGSETGLYPHWTLYPSPGLYPIASSVQTEGYADVQIGAVRASALAVGVIPAPTIVITSPVGIARALFPQPGLSTVLGGRTIIAPPIIANAPSQIGYATVEIYPISALGGVAHATVVAPSVTHGLIPTGIALADAPVGLGNIHIRVRADAAGIARAVAPPADINTDFIVTQVLTGDVETTLTWADLLRESKLPGDEDEVAVGTDRWVKMT